MTAMRPPGTAPGLAGPCAMAVPAGARTATASAAARDAFLKSFIVASLLRAARGRGRRRARDRVRLVVLGDEVGRDVDGVVHVGDRAALVGAALVEDEDD